jgi:hypothetical protein
MTKVGALPSCRVVLPGDLWYYGPLGLPLPSARFRHRLIRAVFARRRRGRRASPVPNRTVSTCRSPYPGETWRGWSGGPSARRGLCRDMSGSALPLFLCRGCRIHVMLRPALLLPPQGLLTPRFDRTPLDADRWPATGGSGSSPGGTLTHWLDPASQDAPWPQPTRGSDKNHTAVIRVAKALSHQRAAETSRNTRGTVLRVETWDAIRARRNIRRYTHRPISAEDLDRVLEAGRRTPSSINQQRWDFVVCTDRDQLRNWRRYGGEPGT